MKCVKLNQINFTFLLIIFPLLLNAQQKAPNRAEGEQYENVIIRGVTLINGTGAPPSGPVDIVIEKNRIKKIQNVIFSRRYETSSHLH